MSNHTRNVGVGLLLSAALSLGLLLSFAAQAQSAPTAQDKIVSTAKNRPLRSLRDAAAQAKARGVVPRPPREVPNFRGLGKPATGGTLAPDALLQSTQGPLTTAAASGFYGTSNNDNGNILGFLVAPPDTDGAVGPNDYVQMVNLLTTVYDKKTGQKLMGPAPSNIFWSTMGGNCEAYNQGDPVVLYDDQANRWIISQFAFPNSMSSFSQCVAVSQTGDPAGAYNRYEFSFVNIGFNDYPKLGIVTDSISMMTNLFNKYGKNFSWAGTFIGVMDKAAMYAGQPATLIGYNLGTSQFGFVAGDLDGPGTAPALFGTAMSTSNHFDIWQLDVDWSNDSTSVSRIASLPITAFNSTICGASRGACIPQPNNGPKLESLSDRLMHRLQIRDFGTYRTMVTAHTVNDGNNRAGIRWYEMRQPAGGAWSLWQEGTFAPNDGLYRWMPSIAMNSLGDIGIGYMVASTNTYVSTAVAGQTVAASGSGLLDSNEQICAAGSGVQTGVSRSGDYSATEVDPGTDMFWHTNEVFTQTGNYQWNTYVCEFAVGDSGGGGTNNPPTALFSSSCNGLACSFTDGSSDSDGSIASWNWDFGDGGTSTAQNPSHTFGSEGSKTVNLTVTDNGGATGSTSSTFNVSNNPPNASFTSSCTGLSCTFTNNSTDSDGSIVSQSWDFGDGTGSSTQTNPNYSYLSDGTYTVKLSVTDNIGAISTSSSPVTVSSAAGSTLVGSSVNNGKTWTATVTDTSGAGLSGSWSSGGGSCSGSVCSLGGIPKKQGSVDFTAASGEVVTVLKP